MGKKRKHDDSDDSSSSDETREGLKGRVKKAKKEKRRKSKKEKHRRKRRHSSDGSSDESGGSSSESSSGEERRRRRKEKKQRKLLKQAKKFLKESNHTTDPADKEGKHHPEKKEDISESDYFLKNPEFSTWLLEEKGIFFSALSTEETHSLFSKFVTAWNEGRLGAKYYRGIESAPRTGHNWGFKLGATKASTQSGSFDAEDDPDDRKKLLKLERKKSRVEKEVLLDELLPKATGREARVEKKMIRRETAKEREASPELLREKDVMGGGDDFQTRLAREKAFRERKAKEKESISMEKQNKYEEEERKKMEQFRALVNSAGGRITIAKRA